ncbi:hypothetical protein SSX86_008765 [Deinandra increscens subsp. villosa]|uniref:Gnk2-homologous domain-containing protein n=1 Tax=Deinandra increscens subsp. villosa TaxID=3103831 RepID=A0AAP0H4Y9_9ASTR
METKSIISLFFILQAINNVVNLVVAQEPRPDQQYFKCSNKGDFETEDLVEERDYALDILYKLFAREKNYTGYEFLITSKGVQAHGLCPSLIKKEACAECINNTVAYLKKTCPKQKEGVAWTALPFLNCMVRYSDDEIQKVLEMSNWAIFPSPPNQANSDPGPLEKLYNSLVKNLKELAAEGDRMMKYGAGSFFYTSDDSPTLYGVMQCLPDLNKDDCIECLSAAVKEIDNCCSYKRTRGGRALCASCYFWYSLDNILEPKTLWTPFVTSP